MRATGASVRTTTPFASAARRNAWVTPPIPPSGKPQVPSCPSPTSPILWWAMTYAVPAERGPAHVPITPLTDSTPFICGDSKCSSSRSAMLIVNRRVTSRGAAHIEPAEPPREPELFEQVAGSPRTDARRDRGQQRTEHLGEPTEPRVPSFVRVGVGRRRIAGSAVACRAASSGICRLRPSRYGTK